MKRVTERWMAVWGSGLVAAFVVAGEPETGGTDVLAKQSAAFLLVSHKIALPASLHRQAWQFTPKFSNDVWSRFERDHEVGPESGAFAEPFYEFCVTVQHLKLLEKDLSNGLDQFEASVSGAMFGRDIGHGTNPTRGGSRKVDHGFFGRPRFEMITPFSFNDSRSRSYGKTRDSFGKRSSHEGPSMALGVRIVIPFGR